MRKLYSLMFAQCLVIIVFAQHISNEQAIRKLIEQYDSSKRKNVKQTKNNVYASGLYGRLIVGGVISADQQKERANANTRKNEKFSSKPLRLEVAKSGDIAYEYGEFQLKFDTADKKHVSWDGTYVRTWKKVDEQWLVDIYFIRPNQD